MVSLYKTGVCEVSSPDAIQTLRPNGLGRVGNRVWDVGDGGLDRERGRGIAGIARSRGRAGMQLLRHRMGLRRRTQRAAAGATTETPGSHATVFGDDGSTEEPPVAGAPGVRPGRRVSAGLH